MTPEERAEKIIAIVTSGIKDGTPFQITKLQIAAEIRAAVQESQHCCFESDSPCNNRQREIINIKAQAYEDAAKIVWDSYNSGMNPSETADAIRARAKELK